MDISPWRNPPFTAFPPSDDLPLFLLHDNIYHLFFGQIYGTDSHTLAALLSSVDDMKRVIRKRSETGTGGVTKRNTDDMEELFQAIQAMGSVAFSEKILQNVNHTYLLSEVREAQSVLRWEWISFRKICQLYYPPIGKLLPKRSEDSCWIPARDWI